MKTTWKERGREEEEEEIRRKSELQFNPITGNHCFLSTLIWFETHARIINHTNPHPLPAAELKMDPVCVLRGRPPL